MTETLATIKTRTSSLLQDTPGFITTTANGLMEDAIGEALEQYSADVPNVVVADFAGDGSAYDFTLPASYVDGPSTFLSIEYPAGERDPLYLEDDDWRIYRTATTTKLRLVGFTPGATETVRATFTASHTIKDLASATVTTILPYHTLAFVNLCASKCLTRLANRFLHEQEPNIGVDAVDRGGKSDAARRLAKALMDAYREEIGATGGETPAIGRIDWDVALASIRGLSMTHDARRR